MKANAGMKEILNTLTFGNPLIAPLKSIADAGFVKKQECYLLRSFAEKLTNAKRADFQDCTGYECFVNSLHVEDYEKQEPVAQAILLVNKLFFLWNASDSPLHLTAIISADELTIVVRFHVKRCSEQWLSDDIDGYSDPVMSVDSDEEIVSQLIRRGGLA
ncbi:hypothetical protein G3N59_16865 [Paraburkholderia sp. Ac-20340]|nr:hypothetical protein [Paraburkholderia sp. Ac-20340]